MALATNKLVPLIRPLHTTIHAVPADLVWPLRRAVRDSEISIDACTRALDDAVETVHFAVQVEGVTVGAVTLTTESDRIPCDGTNRCLRDLVVLREWRGRGIGHQLVDACLSYASAAGAKRVWCTVGEASLPLFHGLGFVATGQSFVDPRPGRHWRVARRLDAHSASDSAAGVASI
jgi:GNAT superfamily N-acetyltransferase